MRPLALLAACLLVGPALAQEAPAPPPPSPEEARFDRAHAAHLNEEGESTIEISGRWPYGYARSVAWAGSTPVTMQGSVFQTLDLSSPGQIEVLGELVLPGVISDMDADGPIVAVTTTHYDDDETGLFLIDVSDPASPVVRGKIPGLGITAVLVRGGTAYAGTFEVAGGAFASLRVISIADPDGPEDLGWVQVASPPTDLAAHGTRVYLAMESAGLGVVDVSDPAAPTVTGTPVMEYTAAVGAGEAGGQPVLAAVVEDQSGTDQLRIYGLTDPDTPTLLGEDGLRTDLVFDAIEMDLVWTEGERVVVGAGYGGLQFADVGDPANPNVRVRRRTRVANVTDGTSRLATDGTTLLVADVFSGLYTADAASRDLLAYRAVPNVAMDVMADGGTVYVAHGTYGVVALQRAAPGLSGETLHFVGRAHGPAWNFTSDLAQTGSHVYAADGFGGVQVVEKATLQTVGTVLASATQPVRRVAVTSDQSLLLAGIGNIDDPNPTGERVVHVYSLADPAAPSFLSTFEPPAGVGDLDGTGGVVWVADLLGQNLRVYDTSSPGTPIPLSDVPMTGSEFRLARDGDRLVSLVTASVANVLDVSLPDTPVVLGTVQSPIGYVGLDVRGERLAMSGTGVGVYDMADLTDPVRLAYSIDFGDVLFDAAFLDADDRLVVAGGHAGVYSVGVVPPTVCDCGPPVDPVSVTASPNPTRGALTVEVSTAAPGTVRAEVLDVLGRRVRLLADGLLVPDRAAIVWDGRDEEGAPAAAGVYLVRVATEGGRVVSRPVTVVR